MSEKTRHDEKTLEELIRDVNRDIRIYEEAIENASAALEAAERELDELLDEAYERDLKIAPSSIL